MKRVLSLFLALLFCFSAFSAVGITVGAASGESITAGRIWRNSWSAEDKSSSVVLDVDMTGFYSITVTDYFKTGTFSIELYDKTEGYNIDYCYTYEITDTYTSIDYFLTKDHEYTLTIQYGIFYDSYIYLDADVGVSFNRTTPMLQTIPTGHISSTDFRYNFDDEIVYFKFRSTSNGRYFFSFDYLHAYVTIYNAATGEIVAPLKMDTEYWDSNYEGWELREGLYFNLDANTDYYIMVDDYSGGTARLAAARIGQGIKNIAPQVPYSSFNCFDPINSYSFSYTITFADNTTSANWSHESLEHAGYEAPYAYLNADIIEINGGYYYPAGKQEVVSYSVYSNTETKIYVTIESFTEHFSYLTPVGEYDTCTIKYEADEEFSYWWRIKVDSSNYYSIYRYDTDDFSTNFESYSISIVDSKNNVVPYDSTDKAWYLKAGEIYALNFVYKYDDYHTYNYVDFWLEEREELKTGWQWSNGKWYYYYKGYIVYNRWQQDSVGWVYLGADGAMVTNKWVRDSAGWCYVGSDGYAVTNCWKKDSIGWCYLGSNGSQVKNKWVNDGGVWYYIGADGYMASNRWVKDTVGWCYLGSDGAMVRSKWIKDGGAWYYINSDGHMAHDCWKKDSIGWVYLDSNGAMVTNRWVRDSGGWCFVGSDGYAVTNCWKRDSVGWCYLGSNGTQVFSKWIKDGGAWYYIANDGYMVYSTSKVINGKTYHFDASGACTNP